MMNLFSRLPLVVVVLGGTTCAFFPGPALMYRPCSAVSSRTMVLFGSSDNSISTAATPANKVLVLEDADAVGSKIRNIVEEAAAKAIAERGHFALAIPGGSILKMLVGSSGDWTSKTTLAYVNHKCVPMDDADLATHAKAVKLFLKDWQGVNVILMNGTDDGPGEASAYEAKLKALPKDVLPLSPSTDLPVFDLALIGVGDDGHIGSLYPGRKEVLEKQAWVLSVDMKKPPSITLSLPVMAGAKQVVVAACGVSDKYPQGKSEGMRRAVVAEDETVETFPAVGLRSTGTWVMDNAAASKLGDEYTSSKHRQQ
jgi:6-phosphogluconolactonase